MWLVWLKGQGFSKYIIWKKGDIFSNSVAFSRNLNFKARLEENQVIHATQFDLATLKKMTSEKTKSVTIYADIVYGPTTVEVISLYNF